MKSVLTRIAEWCRRSFHHFLRSSIARCRVCVSVSPLRQEGTAHPSVLGQTLDVGLLLCQQIFDMLELSQYRRLILRSTAISHGVAHVHVTHRSFAVCTACVAALCSASITLLRRVVSTRSAHCSRAVSAHSCLSALTARRVHGGATSHVPWLPAASDLAELLRPPASLIGGLSSIASVSPAYRPHVAAPATLPEL